MIRSEYMKKLTSVLDQENQRKIEIPIFQRAYSWKQSNWDQFIDDTFYSDDDPFMGVIIGVGEIDYNDTNYQKLILLDGQQRITTISIFLLSLYNRFKQFNEFNDMENEDAIILKNELKKRLTIKKNSIFEPRLSLSKQNNNKDDFDFLIYSTLDIKKVKCPNNFGNRRISHAFKFFNEYCNDEIQNFEILQNKYTSLKKIMFVELAEDSHSDAFKLFDVLNNRGMPLSAMDILRNSIFQEFFNINTDNSYLEDKNIIFNEIMENLGDSSTQTRFLRQFYMAFKHEPKLKTSISKITKGNVVDVYNELIKKDVTYLFDSIREASEIYKDFINFSNGNKFNEMYENLFNLGIAPSYTLLLFLCKKKLFDNEKYKNILLLIRKFFILRNLLDTPPTRELDYLFSKIVSKLNEEINENKNSEDYFTLIKDMLFERKELKDKELLESKISDDIYETNPRMVKYLLCLIEENNRNADLKINLWELKKGKPIFTIEHILPQEGLGKNKEWIKELNTKNEEDARKLRDKYTHKIGNLTLTTSNSKLSDFTFKDKKNRIDKNNMLIGYNNGFFINEYISQQENWNIEKIKERQKLLINKIMKLVDL